MASIGFPIGLIDDSILIRYICIPWWFCEDLCFDSDFGFDFNTVHIYHYLLIMLC